MSGEYGVQAANLKLTYDRFVLSPDSSKPRQLIDEAVALLRSFPVADLQHFGRRLRDHLVGSFSLLVRWEMPFDVCLAGLFHSIYGTATFKDAAVDWIDRPRVRAAIGEPAESLAYLFCAGSRRRLLLENDSPPYFWNDHRSGTRLEIDEHTLNALVMIEAANFVDQLPFIDAVPETTVDDMVRRFDAQRHRLSPRIREALQEALMTRRAPVGH